MEIATVLWSIGAGVALALAALCAVMWLADRRNLAMLMLALLGAATAASAYCELGIMKSLTTAEFGEWQRWYHLPAFVALIAQVLFVQYYLGTGRRWLMWAFISVRTFVLIVNFLVHPNFSFSDIASLRQISLFGELVSVVGVATPRDLQLVSIVSLILLMTYLIDALVEAWLRGDAGTRRKALAIALGIALPVFGSISYTQLIIFGVVQMPLSNFPWFLGALMLMGYELARDFILNARTRLEVAEARANLARVERGAVLGQLASALSHELTQPLQAIRSNITVAHKHLEADKPNLAELKEILADIDSDHRRSGDIIGELRKLFPQSCTVETRPLRVEDVLNDVLALVRAEAEAKHVELSLVLEPRLPRVLGDRVHLPQVLLNLLANGIRAVEQRPLDARRVVVEARADQIRGEVEITVRDSGPGIPSTLGDSIFKPYFSTKLEGVGMGLALSRTIIEAHGGRLWADDQTPEQGAVFRLTLRPV